MQQERGFIFSETFQIIFFRILFRIFFHFYVLDQIFRGNFVLQTCCPDVLCKTSHDMILNLMTLSEYSRCYVRKP